VRTAWEKSVRFPFALQDHWIFRKVCLLAAKVLDFAFVLFSQVVKPQTIPLWIHELAELILQTAALSRVQQTLKHGILHPLTVVDTLLGDLPQTPAPSGIFCIDIIGDEYQHTPLTSTKTADIPPDRPADTAPAASSVHTVPTPTAAFPLKTGG
jgi:hypothetical protein